MSQFPMSAMLLKQARRNTGLLQRDFIEVHDLQVTQATYSRWENGKIVVPAEVLLKIGALEPAIGGNE